MVRSDHVLLYHDHLIPMNHSPALANALRVLSMDAIQKSGSGHPGMPMGMADIATVLWLYFLKHNPNNPNWSNRDRFVLSNGHGSMLQYALLHLSGYDLSIEDIKQFRQLYSKTPGHPEYGITPGVETTTGPLGQGFANAVGMAIAEKHLAAYFNRSTCIIVDHFTYVFLGDGCLMEGISHEAASLAGCLGLGKLIAFWDNNGISIDGSVTPWFTDNTPERFASYGWHVMLVDGHDPAQIEFAIKEAQKVSLRPSLLCCKTIIGFGSPNLAGDARVHGAPLGEQEVLQARQQLGWTDEAFVIPDAIYQAWDACDRGAQWEQSWNEQWILYEKDYPELAQEFTRRMQGQLPENLSHLFQCVLKETINQDQAMATRKASQKVLNQIGPILPELFGGSADLTESNATLWSGCQRFDKYNLVGNYLHYGVREFGMSALMNGIALHGGLIPYGGTFLVFSDYARNAVRLAALMRLRVIFIYSHDSIGLGEDGPTHQPIEHINALRLIPNLSIWRPCDIVETALAWQAALERIEGPTCLLLSRQNLPTQRHTEQTLKLVSRGGYILIDGFGPLDAIIIATGSEVQLAVRAATLLTEQGKSIRVVSFPCIDRFAQQDTHYQESVLPSEIMTRICIEAGTTHLWHTYAGPWGRVIGIDHYGFSAPGDQVFKACAVTTDILMNTVNELIIINRRKKHDYQSCH